MSSEVLVAVSGDSGKIPPAMGHALKRVKECPFRTKLIIELKFITQRSKLTFSKSHLLVTFNCKMLAIKKIWSPKKKLEGVTLLMVRKTR